ncbi:MAG: transporter substrate-binding domain-containing protein [Bacillota bacterium]
MLKEIKIGLLFSLHGTTAVIERDQFNSAMLAINKINNSGGIEGYKLVPVVEDINSDPVVTAKKTHHLINNHQVVTMLGCYTSACRRAALPVLELNDVLLIYPTLYEGEEHSENIFYCGATPNQQLQAFIPWILDNLGQKVFLIGSDYVYPRETNRQVKNLISDNGGNVVGEAYQPLGWQDFSRVIDLIKFADSEVVFSTLVGDNTVNFYQQFYKKGLRSKEIPICSSITSESEIKAMQARYAYGHYTSFGYFQSVNTPENEEFVEMYKFEHGQDSVLSSVMEASYFGVFLLCQALKIAKDFSFTNLRDALSGQVFQAPQGKIMIDKNNQHTWLWSRVGQANEKGQFDIVWESGGPIKPEPWVSVLFPSIK